MPPTAEDFQAALAEIEEDTAMPPGMTQAQYAEAREMMERVEDVEFYNDLIERTQEYRRVRRRFIEAEMTRIKESFLVNPDDTWGDIGDGVRERFIAYAAKEMREKYRTSGELLECVREAVMGVEA